MGSFFATALDKINIGKKRKKVLIIGLDNSGKTTALFKLKIGHVPTTVPSCMFFNNVDTVEYNDLTLYAWDLGGHERIRVIWRHYYPNTDGIIYIVDATDKDRINGAHYELHRTLCDMDKHMDKCPILILANKMDLPNTMSLQYIKQKMGMYREIPIEPSYFKDIKQDTMLKYLPDDVFNIIVDYSAKVEDGPMVKIHPHHLVHQNNGLNNDKKIIQIICDYLPNYLYSNRPSNIYNVMGCSAATGDGLQEAIEWITNAINGKQS